ncbi:MAG: hypothetical protein ACREXU_15740 [Gammaproteobacteria bacterium]
MNRTEHLLACLAEEAAEVAQAANKALRFGLAHEHPKIGMSNARHLAVEINDLLAVAALLEDCGALLPISMVGGIEAKRAKVMRYMEVAEQLGALDAS